MHAGVSVGTVSNVLNTPEKVKEPTREAVQAAMDELGFIRSYAASQLRRKVSQTVGIIVLDINNPFFMEAASAIEKRLRRSGCTMMLASSDGAEKREADLLNLYASMDVRGVIMTPCGGDTENYLQNLETRIKDLNAPVVLFDHPPIGDLASTIFVDDEIGEYKAVSHLIQLGHERIGFINGPIRIRQSVARLKGATKAFKENGLNPETLTIIEARAYTSQAGADAMAGILEQHPEITAVACANDLLAIGAMRTLRENEISIPDEMSLVGYDDVSIASQLITPLTSVHQPMNAMGWQSVELLLDEEGAPQEKHFDLTPELVVRKSTAPPRL